METIYKYKLSLQDVQDVPVIGFKGIVTVQIQNGGLVMWCLIEDKDYTTKVIIEIIGTGNPIPKLAANEMRRYISTVQDGNFVWHIFQIEKI